MRWRSIHSATSAVISLISRDAGGDREPGLGDAHVRNSPNDHMGLHFHPATSLGAIRRVETLADARELLAPLSE